MQGKLGEKAIYWVMLPAGALTEETIDEIASIARPGDILIDGGNSYYKDDIRRAKALHEKRLEYVDIGVSGGVWGLQRGYCMMIGETQRSSELSSRSSRRLLPAMATSFAQRVATPLMTGPRRATSTRARPAPATL